MKTEWKITLAYFIVGILWIYFSDTLLYLLLKDAEKLNIVQIYKGCIYVIITAFLLYLMLRLYYRQLNGRIKEVEAQNKQLQEISWMQSHLVLAPLARLIGCVNLLLEESVAASEENTVLLNAVKKSAMELDEIVCDITKKANIKD